MKIREIHFNEKKLQNIKDNLLSFSKNLYDLKECLKDNNFDIAKEKMSLFRGNPERAGTIPNYAYSDDERENSFDFKQEHQTDSKERTS